MTTLAPQEFEQKSASGLEEVNKSKPSLISGLAKIFGRRNLNGSGSAYINRLKAMLDESNVGQQSLNVLDKDGYLIDFDNKTDVASRVDPENKRIFLNPSLSKETNALSLVHAARTVWQIENAARPNVNMTVNTYLAAAEVCKADALATQMLFATQMQAKDPKIYAEFKKNGNYELCAQFEQSGKANLDRPALIDRYLAETKSPMKIKCTMQALNEINSKMAGVYKDKNAAGLFSQDKTFKEIINAACKDYDGKTYYQGENAVDAPARVTIPDAKAAIHYDCPDMVDFMYYQKRSAESLGLKNVCVASDSTIDMADFAERRNKRRVRGPVYGWKHGKRPYPKNEKPAEKKEEKTETSSSAFKGTIRRHYGGR